MRISSFITPPPLLWTKLHVCVLGKHTLESKLTSLFYVALIFDRFSVFNNRKNYVCWGKLMCFMCAFQSQSFLFFSRRLLVIWIFWSTQETADLDCLCQTVWFFCGKQKLIRIQAFNCLVETLFREPLSGPSMMANFLANRLEESKSRRRKIPFVKSLLFSSSPFICQSKSGDNCLFLLLLLLQTSDRQQQSPGGWQKH